MGKMREGRKEERGGKEEGEGGEKGKGRVPLFLKYVTGNRQRTEWTDDSVAPQNGIDNMTIESY